MSNEKTTNAGISVMSLLGVAFIVLKLCKVINWSWWWITAPFWGGVALVVVILIIAVIIALVNEIKHG